LRHEAREGELPVVGDWVAALLRPEEASATIVACLPRRTSLVRKRAGRASAPQVLAANLDTVLLRSSLNDDLNPRRIERTLALIWESGAQPVVLLSKLDVCSDPERSIGEIEQVAIGVPVHAISTHSGAGLSVLERFLQPGRTLALIGSSGVGKSTLANALLGEQLLATSEVRESDQRGKHTTTARELFVLPSGAMLIDTPGMRELGLWDAADGFSATFDDIEDLARRCRFGDCTHEREPGCAINRALAQGELDPARLASYRKLLRELAHEARRRDPQAMAAYKQHNRQIFRARNRVNRARSKR
jgi:ribosome biogenesis GTPase